MTIRTERRAELQTKGQSHQHVYAQLLQTKIPKTQKDSQVISVFGAFGI